MFKHYQRLCEGGDLLEYVGEVVDVAVDDEVNVFVVVTDLQHTVT